MFGTSTVESSFYDYNSYNRVSVNINGNNNQVNISNGSFNVESEVCDDNLPTTFDRCLFCGNINVIKHSAFCSSSCAEKWINWRSVGKSAFDKSRKLCVFGHSCNDPCTSQCNKFVPFSNFTTHKINIEVDDYVYKCRDCHHWLPALGNCYILPNNHNSNSQACTSFITTEDYKNEERAAKLRSDTEYMLDKYELGYKIPLDNTKVKVTPSPQDPFQSLNLKPRRWTIRLILWLIKVVKWICNI